jgi:hypothetical protein
MGFAVRLPLFPCIFIRFPGSLPAAILTRKKQFENREAFSLRRSQYRVKRKSLASLMYLHAGLRPRPSPQSAIS